MARPFKCRRVCTMPDCTHFGPKSCRVKGKIIMALDEYEAIRLIDHEGLTQQECAGQMAVARTTVQFIYAQARKKLAACLVNGADLIIEGGEVIVLNHHSKPCGHGCGCYKLCSGDNSFNSEASGEETSSESV